MHGRRRYRCRAVGDVNVNGRIGGGLAQGALDVAGDHVGGHAGWQDQPDGARQSAVSDVRLPLHVASGPQDDGRDEVDRSGLRRALLSKERNVPSTAHVAHVAAGQTARLGIERWFAGPEVHAAGNHHRAPHACARAFAVGSRSGATPGAPDQPSADAQSKDARQAADGPCWQRAHWHPAPERCTAEGVHQHHTDQNARPRTANQQCAGGNNGNQRARAGCIHNIGGGATNKAMGANRNLQRAFRATLIGGELAVRMLRGGRARQAGQGVGASRATGGGRHAEIGADGASSAWHLASQAMVTFASK